MGDPAVKANNTRRTTSSMSHFGLVAALARRATAIQATGVPRRAAG